MRGLVEFINRKTGEPVSIPAGQVTLFRSRDENGDIQVVSVKYSGLELDITETYDEFCFKMKKAGYDIIIHEEYNPM